MRITPPPLTFFKRKSQSLGSGAYHSSGLRLAIQQSGCTFLIRYLGDISPICCRAGSFPIGWREPRSAKLRTHHYFPKTPSSVRGITLGRLAASLHTFLLQVVESVAFLSATVPSCKNVLCKQNKPYTLRITIK